MNDTSMPKNESGKKMFTFELSPIKECKDNGHDDVCSKPLEVTTKRLGMGGPAQKIQKEQSILSPSVNVQDISQSMASSSSVTLLKFEKKEVIIRFKCTLCNKMSFTRNGYDYHLFTEHKTRNKEDFPPEIIKGHDILLTSSGEVSDGSSLPNIIGPSRKSNVQYRRVKYVCDDSKKPHKCEQCPECFYYEKSLETHVTHAHNDSEESKEGKAAESKVLTSLFNKNKPIKRHEPKIDDNKGKPPKQSKKASVMSLLGDQKIQTDVAVSSARQTHSQSKMRLAQTDQEEKEEKEKPALESSTEMSKEEYVKTYSLWLCNSQISQEGESNQEEGHVEVDVSKNDDRVLQESVVNNET